MPRSRMRSAVPLLALGLLAAGCGSGEPAGGSAGSSDEKAQAFMDLVRSAEGRRVLERFGFLAPPTA
jgi:hypothetical protein